MFIYEDNTCLGSPHKANTINFGCILLKGRKKFAQNFGSGIMQFYNEQTPSFNLVYSRICYPAGMGTSKIRLLFVTLLQHYMAGPTWSHLRPRYVTRLESDIQKENEYLLLSCQPRVTVRSCFVDKVISDL